MGCTNSSDISQPKKDNQDKTEITIIMNPQQPQVPMMQPMNMGFLPPPNQFGAPPMQFIPPPNQFGPPPTQFIPPPNQFGPPPTQFIPPPNQFGPPPNQIVGPPPAQFVPQPNQPHQPSHQLILPQNLIGVVGYYEDLHNCKFNWRWIIKDPETQESVRAVTIERVDEPLTVLDSGIKFVPDMLQKKDPKHFASVINPEMGQLLFNWRWIETIHAGERSVVTIEQGERQYDEPEISPAPANTTLPVAAFEWKENSPEDNLLSFSWTTLYDVNGEPRNALILE